jgi:hypothetical protein
MPDLLRGIDCLTSCIGVNPDSDMIAGNLRAINAS